MVATTLRNFPYDFGAVIGIVKSFYGLSASVYARVYSTWFSHDPDGFLLFLVFTPAFALLCLFFVRFAPKVSAGFQLAMLLLYLCPYMSMCGLDRFVFDVVLFDLAEKCMGVRVAPLRRRKLLLLPTTLGTW